MGIESIKKEGAMALFLEHITSLSDAELKAQLLVTKGAVHAVRNLLGREVTIENVEHMLDSLLEQEQMIDDLITKQPLPSPPNKKIYEVRDITDDEIYYTLGLFLTKELAINAIKEIDRHGNDYYNYEECAEYEVVIHKTDCFYEPTKKDVVFSVVFKEKYNEEKDENEWEISEENYFN